MQDLFTAFFMKTYPIMAMDHDVPRARGVYAMLSKLPNYYAQGAYDDKTGTTDFIYYEDTKGAPEEYDDRLLGKQTRTPEYRILHTVKLTLHENPAPGKIDISYVPEFQKGYGLTPRSAGIGNAPYEIQQWYESHRLAFMSELCQALIPHV